MVAAVVVFSLLKYMQKYSLNMDSIKYWVIERS